VAKSYLEHSGGGVAGLLNNAGHLIAGVRDPGGQELGLSGGLRLDTKSDVVSRFQQYFCKVWCSLTRDLAQSRSFRKSSAPDVCLTVPTELRYELTRDLAQSRSFRYEISSAQSLRCRPCPRYRAPGCAHQIRGACNRAPGCV
jgi:hypothetical protein